MFDWVTHAVLSFVSDYGYLAVFVYMALETGFILHFAPSELVVPFAATQLVHDPFSFGLFVLDATLGATVGSVLAYYVIGKNSEYVLGRWGYLVHVSDDDIQRGQRWFGHWGESSVFWGRMLPLMRAAISIPAGIAEMDLRKFVTYSASGAFVFNLLLTFLVYSGSGETSPLGLLLSKVSEEVTEVVTYVQVHPRVGRRRRWHVRPRAGRSLALPELHPRKSGRLPPHHPSDSLWERYPRRRAVPARRDGDAAPVVSRHHEHLG
ncbi:DedA family protein [Haladaptatus sp. R4]|uniref:DedA family protein n=1 Tax=Haladaptatus sp. R4 TaxID=1679489 RepID=UPI000A690750|nr:DedA family protein [Haladaptatus sp. R4]